MRPQNGKRGRSRGRNKSSHGNLNRTLESNGPDVKIRGTASHIHEKYLQLARDAHSSGDRVGAENYLQHAEHYHRMMMASLPPGQTMAMQQGPQAQYANGESHQEDTETDTPETGEALPPQYLPQSAQQPREPREQREGREQPREPREQQPQEAREQRGDREQGQPRGERGDRGDRGEGGHQDRRLNGRSRRVTDERAVNGNGRVITSLDGEDGQAPAPAQPQGEAQGDDSDEALA